MRVDGATVDVIQASKPGPRIMRCEFSEHEWCAIKPMLPNKPRGARRVDDRRLLDGVVWVLRSGAPWRRPAGDLWSPHDLLQSPRSVDDGLVSLICPTCQMSTSAFDECRLLCMGLFSIFWLGAPRLLRALPPPPEGCVTRSRMKRRRVAWTVALFSQRPQKLHQLAVHELIPADHVPGLQRIIITLEP